MSADGEGGRGSRIKAVYTCVGLLIDEMDGKQRPTEMVERMRALLIAVNHATPLEVVRVLSALARLAKMSDN